MSGPARLRFRRGQRLRGQGAFKRVLDGRARVDASDFAVHARPNDGPETRIGISIGVHSSRSFANAVGSVRRIAPGPAPHTSAIWPFAVVQQTVLTTRPDSSRQIPPPESPLDTLSRNWICPSAFEVATTTPSSRLPGTWTPYPACQTFWPGCGSFSANSANGSSSVVVSVAHQQQSDRLSMARTWMPSVRPSSIRMAPRWPTVLTQWAAVSTQ